LSPGAGSAAAVPTVQVSVPAGVDAELAVDALWQAGAVAIQERSADGGPGAGGAAGDVVLVAGVGAGGDIPSLVAAVEAVGRPGWTIEVVQADLDAALDAWRPHARPVRVGRLQVHPPWVATGSQGSEQGAVEVVIDPGRAFGSGAHSSTRLGLAALDRLVTGGERVLDAGCGSGVLAIAALALGAAEAVGVDHDPLAQAASRSNAARNGVADRLAVSSDPIDAVVAAQPPFDLVVANLLLPDLVAVAPGLRAAVGAAGGVLVFSGVLVGQRAAVVDGAGHEGLTVTSEETLDGWWAATLTAR
jgi:ribosomal protein L11 methyltransferase